MDPLAHGLMGALIGRVWASARAADAPAPLEESTGMAMVWGALLANAPDIDLFYALHGRGDFLDHHRGFTHSLVVLPLFAGLAAWLLRWRRGREPFGRYYGLAFFAILSHILADLSGSYGIFLFSPLSNHRFRLDSLFIIDWIVIVLCAVSFAAALSWRAHGRAIARTGLLALGIYALGCAGIHAYVLHIWHARLALAGPVPARLAAVPQFGGPWFWLLLADDGKTTTATALTLGPRLNLAGEGAAGRYFRRFHAADELALKSFVTAPRARPDDAPLLRSFLDFARFPTYWRIAAGGGCTVAEGGAPQGHFVRASERAGGEVHWRDLQYGWDEKINPFHLIATLTAEQKAKSYRLARSRKDTQAEVTVVPPRAPPQTDAGIPCEP